MGIPADLNDGLKAWLSEPSTDNARTLVGVVRAFLDAEGESFHQDMEGIQQWLFFTREGKAAFERWGCR